MSLLKCPLKCQDAYLRMDISIFYSIGCITTTETYYHLKQKYNPLSVKTAVIYSGAIFFFWITLNTILSNHNSKHLC